MNLIKNLKSAPVTRVGRCLTERRMRGGKLLIPFFTAGYPSLAVTRRLLLSAAEAGADLIEIGMPFSDPLADGPTIQYSSQAALKSGMTLRKTLDLVGEMSPKISVPILLMGYYNPLLAFGLGRFCAAARNSSVAGLIIPDLPPEEALELSGACRRNGISLTFFAAPTSTDWRIELAGKMSTDFVYAVTVTGVTGARKGYAVNTGAYLRKVRRLAQKPVVAGFGVSSAASAARLATAADGVVIGSALIDLIRESGNQRAAEAVGRRLKSIRRELDKL